MFDFARLTDFVGGLVGQQATDAGLNGLAGLTGLNGLAGLTDLTQHLGELGVDVSQLDGLAGQELMQLINENGLDITQLDPQSLMTLAEQAGIEVPFAEVLDTFANRPGAE